MYAHVMNALYLRTSGTYIQWYLQRKSYDNAHLWLIQLICKLNASYKLRYLLL